MIGYDQGFRLLTATSIGLMLGAVFFVSESYGGLAVVESTDFPGFLGPTVGTLDLGTNTVSGTLTSFTDFTDRFFLIVPANLEITTIDLTASNFVQATNGATFLNSFAFDSTPTFTGSTASLSNDGTAAYAPGTEFPLGADTYNFHVAFGGGFKNAAVDWTLTYELASVPAVPLPAADWLGIAMLGGLGITQIIRSRRLAA